MSSENFEMKDEFAGTEQQPSQQNWDNAPASDNEPNPLMIRRKIKGGYNWAGSVILFQVAIITVLYVIINSIYSTILTTQIMAENPDIQYPQLIAEVTETASADTDFAVVLNSICCIVADLAAFIIVFFAAKRFKMKELFSKSEVSAFEIFLAVVSCFGMQGISLHIQNLVMSITGYSGISEEMAASLSFSDKPIINVILVLYAVILGPILEELMFRGAAMNLLAPVNRTFALIVSSLLFGLMHCNFNQIFNGFLLGLVFGYIALKSGSIIPSMICHIFANANAFLVSYIFEEKLASTIDTELALNYEMAVFAAEAVIGIAAMVLLLRKKGKVNPSDMVTPSYSYVVEDKDEKKLTVKAVLTSPTVIIAALYCIGTACMYVTKIPME